MTSLKNPNTKEVKGKYTIMLETQMEDNMPYFHKTNYLVFAPILV